MSEQVFLFEGDSPEMQQANASARASFKYFWRELSWERRRIIPALDMAMIKLPFSDGPRTDDNPEVEHMWVNDVEFDGITLAGTLINAPNRLTSVKQGDAVSVPFAHLGDWMMVAGGKAYGAYTVNVMRSQMKPRERKDHDEAWGLDFGDPNTIRIELSREKEPKKGVLSKLLGKSSRLAPADVQQSFADHPMCRNMVPKVEETLKGDPSIATSVDERGWTMLHHEAMAGNLGVVALLVQYGANVGALTADGRNAATLAQNIGWDEIATYLANTGA